MPVTDPNIGPDSDIAAPSRNASRNIYLDYNATTPLDPHVLEAMLPYLTVRWGNPSSIHRLGRDAKAALDEARYGVSDVWQCRPSEVVFTSGGTESNNLALVGSSHLLASQGRGRHIITSQIEHHAVLHTCRYLAAKLGFEVTYVAPDRDGRVSADAVGAAFRDDTVLVSVMAANNETGSIQPVSEIGDLCHSRGILFHTDAVQWFGKLPFDSIHQFHADLVSSCAHKFHGPKGAGALFIQSPLLPDPILFGGGHENERRAGTENLPAIVGFAEAFRRFVPKPVFDPDALGPLTSRLRSSLSTLPGLSIHSPAEHGLANTVAFSMRHSDSLTLLATLDLAGICASSGSACSVGSLAPSHVLLAMGVDPDRANALVRLSIGRETTPAMIAEVIRLLPSLLATDQPGAT